MALTGPTRQQVLQLMMIILESKLAQTHVALTGPTRQQVLQLMMTILVGRIVPFYTVGLYLLIFLILEPLLSKYILTLMVLWYYYSTI